MVAPEGLTSRASPRPVSRFGGRATLLDENRTLSKKPRIDWSTMYGRRTRKHVQARAVPKQM